MPSKRPSVLDGECARVAAAEEGLEAGPEIDVALAELAVLAAFQPFQVDVTHYRLKPGERGGRIDAGFREIDRIEVHPDVRPASAIEDLAADIRVERRAIVILEHEVDRAGCRSDSRMRLAAAVSAAASEYSA